MSRYLSRLFDQTTLLGKPLNTQHEGNNTIESFNIIKLSQFHESLRRTRMKYRNIVLIPF